jgi:hypothetical protein
MTPKSAPLLLTDQDKDGDRAATDQFCNELAQSMQDDLDPEGYFYQDTPQFISVGKL